ncbi:MAG: Tat pathway signal protein [Desulfopila sp.]
MEEERRDFLKATLGATALGVTTLMAAKCGAAGVKPEAAADANGVVIGQSPKKEILYKKTAAWELYYKVAY